MARKTTRKTPISFSRHIAPFAPLALALAVGAGMQGANTKAISAPTIEQQESAESVGFAPSCTNPGFPTDARTFMDESSCTASGNGGKETSQNEVKNNFCAAGDPNPDTPTMTSIAELVALQKQVEQIPNINFGNTFVHPLTSQPGPVLDRKPLQKLGEGKLVQLIGFVKIARPEGEESVNCGKNVPNDAAHHDIHITLLLSSADPECAGVVVEMTPHHRPEAWTPALVNQVSSAGMLVRVTGQQMFDSSHTPCVNGSPIGTDPARISLWEVHPIYKFEVCPQGNCQTGGWVPLEAWKQS